MKLFVAMGASATLFVSSVQAEDYKDVTNAAYCIGVYQSDIQEFKRIYAPIGRMGLVSTQIRDLELKLFRSKTMVEGAIKQRKIDGVTASNMRSVGYAEG